MLFDAINDEQEESPTLAYPRTDRKIQWDIK